MFFFSKLNLWFLSLTFYFNSFARWLLVGLSRERTLWWRISVHREPSGASPSPRKNRGHRRLTAPLFPVSKLFAACCICTAAHRHVCRCSHVHSPVHSLSFSPLLPRQKAIIKLYRAAVKVIIIISSYGKCRWLIGVNIQHEARAEALILDRVEECENFSHLFVCSLPPTHTPMKWGVSPPIYVNTILSAVSASVILEIAFAA